MAKKVCLHNVKVTLFFQTDFIIHSWRVSGGGVYVSFRQQNEALEPFCRFIRLWPILVLLRWSPLQLGGKGGAETSTDIHYFTWSTGARGGASGGGEVHSLCPVSLPLTPHSRHTPPGQTSKACSISCFLLSLKLFCKAGCLLLPGSFCYFSSPNLLKQTRTTTSAQGYRTRFGAAGRGNALLLKNPDFCTPKCSSTIALKWVPHFNGLIQQILHLKTDGGTLCNC